MIDLKPVPHVEAIAFLKGKPAVLRKTFDAMLPEIRARAFTIAHVENLKVLQDVRDRIAALPAGANWDEVRKDVALRISPHLADSDDPADREEQLASAFRRAELLLRTHGYQAYEAASYNAMQESVDAFPYWQYQTMEDGAVRPEHAALNGLVLPADSPFWRDHYPPWDWGCRCTVVALAPEDVDELRAADARRNPEDRLVLEGAQRRRLEEHGELVRGPIALIDPNDPDRRRVTGKLPGGKFDVRSPREKGEHDPKSGAKRNVFSWEPGSMKMDVAQLRSRYDAPVWAAFERSMRAAKLWAWVTGRN
jgi:SPP1 gp7 family putative phage head morphogenesis protein